MLLPLILVRLLTHEDVGVFRIFFLYLVTVPAFSFTAGLMSGLAYWSGQAERRDAAFQVSSIVILLSSLLFMVGTVLAHQEIAEWFSWKPHYAVLFGFSVFGAIAGSFFEEAAIATGRIWTGALFLSGFEIVRTVTIVLTAYLTRSLDNVFAVHAGLSALKVGIGWILGARLGITGFRFSVPVFRDVWRYAFPVSTAWIFGVFVTYADQIILSTNISATAFAFYSIGCLSLAPLFILEQSVTRVLIPEMAGAFAKGENRRAGDLFFDAVENLAFFLIPAAVGLSVFAQPIIRLLFTAEYLPSAEYLTYYAFAYLFLIIPFDAVPRAKGQAGWILRSFVWFSILSLASAYFLTQSYGPFGGLAAIFITRFAIRAYAVWYVRENTGWSLTEFLPLALVWRSSLMCAVLAACSIAARTLFSTDLHWFFVCGTLFAIIYLALGLYLKNRIDRRLDRKPGVLILTQSVEIGGIERMVLSLCRVLCAGGQWRVSVFSYDQEGGRDAFNLVPEFRSSGIPIVTYKKGRGFSLPVVIRLMKMIFREDLSIIHCQDLGGLIYGVVAKVLSMGRVRIVHTQHSFVHLQKNRRYQIYEKIFTLFIDQLTVVSSDTREQYVALGFDPKKIHLIQNGVEFSEIGHTPSEGRDALVSRIRSEGDSWGSADFLSRNRDAVWIVYIARLHPVKGQDHALALWRDLSEATRTAAILIFVGPESEPGEVQRLRRIIATVPERERILCVGPSKKPSEWLEVGDVYLSSSTFEGMPLGPLEAVGSGVPALLSEIPGHEFLKGYTSQYPLSSPARGAEILSRLIAAAQSDARGSRAAMEQRTAKLRGEYSIETMAHAYERVYRSVV
jgi:O-antigen/teichoic acid export membrane protein/glycosyltransferase involved in cell wall biosynthesis